MGKHQKRTASLCHHRATQIQHLLPLHWAGGCKEFAF